MPMSGAERQARYRAKRLRTGGDAAQLNVLVPVAALARLRRLAAHWDLSQGEVLDRLTAAAESDLIATLGKQEAHAYLERK
jgi:hypothetical protein